MYQRLSLSVSLLLTAAVLPPLSPAVAAPLASARPAAGPVTEVLTGVIRNVDRRHDRIKVEVPGEREIEVETRGSFIFLGATKIGYTGDLKRGLTVEVTGTRGPDGRFEARSVRVLPAPTGAAARDPEANFTLDGVVVDSDTARARATLADKDGRRFTLDYLDADLEGTGDGRRNWLSRGMHVIATGTRLPRSVVVADRVRVLSGNLRPSPVATASSSVEAPAPVLISTPDAILTPAALRKMGRLAPEAAAPETPAPAPTAVAAVAAPLPCPASPDPKDVLGRLDTYTGVLIDARHLRGINRSPAPLVLGPDSGILYPDRAHVPTPDQVQEASVIRYYRSEDDAKKAGVLGGNPLVLPAQALFGPGNDGVRLSGTDMVLLMALDQRLGVSKSWKVGVLVPPDK